MNRPDIIFSTTETVKKIMYRGDTFYVMGDGIYLMDDYGMHFIAARNQRVGKRLYTPEMYIHDDPNRAIMALKDR